MRLEILAIYKKHKRATIHKYGHYDARHPAYGFRHEDVLAIMNEIHHSRSHMRVLRAEHREMRLLK